MAKGKKYFFQDFALSELIIPLTPKKLVFQFQSNHPKIPRVPEKRDGLWQKIYYNLKVND
jgi:hypothetical protein